MKYDIDKDVEKLLPCPFCGGGAEIDTTSNLSLVYIGCMKCGVKPQSTYQTSFPEWREEAIEDWNTRANSDAVKELKEAQEENKRLRGALEDVVESYDLFIQEVPQFKGMIEGFFLWCTKAKEALKLKEKP